MSTWRERLNYQKGPPRLVPEVPEVAFGTFGTEAPATSGKTEPLTDRQTKALAILKADPAQRRAFCGEPTPEGYRLAVAIRRPDGEIVVGEMVLPAGADPLRAITSCPP